MATVSSSSGTSAAQFGLEQLRLQQTRLAADRAEQTAQSLQSEAAAARRDADQARQRAQSLESESSQAKSEAFRMRQSVMALQSGGQAQVARAVDNAKVTETKTGTAVVQQQSGTSATSHAPVVNTQGQVTGRVINTTA